tara:strand:+ start:656 stop:1492 length:837 start_codon:yes stop_codon:yes gene_type:complete
MILSNTAEFTPWVIQPQKENHFTEMPSLRKTIDLNNDSDEIDMPTSEGMNTDELVANELSETIVDDEVSAISQNPQEHKEEETIPPELVPKYTTAQLNEYGEAEYLRGYNSCKENEQLEFSGRLEQLDSLIATLMNEHVDLNEFYEPIRELIISAVGAIMQVDLTESSESISKIVAKILEEITLESDGSVRLFLSPGDTSLLAGFEPDTENPVKILSDPRLTNGSARAVMGSSIIESMKENRIEQIVDQIMGETKKKKVSTTSKSKTSNNKRSARKKT